MKSMILVLTFSSFCKIWETLPLGRLLHEDGVFGVDFLLVLQESGRLCGLLLSLQGSGRLCSLKELIVKLTIWASTSSSELYAYMMEIA